MLALAGSVVLQGHMVWAPPLVFAGAAGLAAVPVARGAPRAPHPDARRRALAAGRSSRPLAVACVLWALPVYDELTGEYKNFRRILTMGTEEYEPRSWAESLGPCLRALELRRDGQAPGASFEWGARNVGVDPRLGMGGTAGDITETFTPREALWAAALAAGLVACFVMGAKRGAATAPLALAALLAGAALPVVARQSPGRELPWYLLQWGAMVTLVALLAIGIEAIERSRRARALGARQGGPGCCSRRCPSCCSRAPSGPSARPGPRRATRERSPSSGSRGRSRSGRRSTSAAAVSCCGSRRTRTRRPPWA